MFQYQFTKVRYLRKTMNNQYFENAAEKETNNVLRTNNNIRARTTLNQEEEPTTRLELNSPH